MYRLCVSVFLFCLLTDHNNAQIHLHGIVRDSVSNAPITGALVVLGNTNFKRNTSSDGRFDFDSLTPGLWRIGVRQFGYYDRTLEIALKRDTTIVIAMSPLSLQARQVVVETLRPTTSGTEHTYQLTTKELDRHRGQTFGELIKQVPGVTLLSTGPAIAKPVIRGFHSLRVGIISNGIQHQAQEWGLDHAPAIDPFTPASIALSSGAASIEYSYSAIGGTIRLDMEPLAYHQSSSGKLSLVGSTNNGMIAASMMAHTADVILHNSALSVQLSGHIAGDSHSPSYVLSNTGSRQLSGTIRFGYDAGMWRHEINYSLFTTYIGILTASHLGNYEDLQHAIARGEPAIKRPFTYAIGNPYQSITHQTLQLYSTHTASYGTIELRYGWQLNHRREYDAHNLRYRDSTVLSRVLQKPAIELAMATYELDAKLRHSLVLPSSSGSIGIHLVRQANARGGNVFLVPDYTLYEGGIYCTEHILVGSWLLSLGIRGDGQWLDVRPYDRSTGRLLNDTTLLFTGIAVHIGAEYSVNKSAILRLNLATRWRPPSPIELYANDVHHGTATYEIGSRNLLSERSISLDATLKTMIGDLTMETTAHGTILPRFILLMPDPQPTVTYRGTFPTMRYHQQPSVIAGMEFHASIPISSILRTDLTCALVRGYRTDNEMALPFLPADQARVSLHAHVPEFHAMSNSYCELALRLVRRRDDVRIFDYAPPPPGYILVDIYSGTEFQISGLKTQFALEIENVFDTPYRDYLSRYRYFSLNPGRNILLRLTIPFSFYVSPIDEVN